MTAVTGRPCGTRKAYGAGCRCTPCRTANRNYLRDRRRRAAYGTWEPYAAAEPVRAHIATLRASGLGLPAIARLSGVHISALQRAVYGGTGLPPGARMNPETAAAVLAVRAGATIPGAVVDPTGTRRRLQALTERGWPVSQIAPHAGMTANALRRVLSEGRGVRAWVADAVATAYGELWDVPPAPVGGRAALAVTRARAKAKTAGWPPPAAWDDAAIDDPAASPAPGWRPGTHHSRAGTGDRRWARAELAAMRMHTGYGPPAPGTVTARQAAKRLGVTERTIQRWKKDLASQCAA